MPKITKELLEKLYSKEKLSNRKIASKLNVGKTTIEYYLKKYEIKTRSQKEAAQLCKGECNWTKGLNKENDLRIKKLANSIKEGYLRKREGKIKELESRWKKPLKEIIKELYWEKGLSQQEISKEIKFDRSLIIKWMKEFNISKRPKYQYISSLKGENHAMFGKDWENHFGKEKSEKRKKEHSERFRKLTIKRLQENKFPFFNTEIELIMAKELLRRKIPFVKQFNFEKKFVCDFAIPDLKILIECDGDYWHANPEIYSKDNLTKTQKEKVQRDNKKNKLAKEKGWKMFRFFESDIKESISQCVDKIESYIKYLDINEI